MTSGDLLKVTVKTPVEAEEVVAALVERVFGQAPALYTDEETLMTEVSVFLDSERKLGPARCVRLESGLRRLRSQGIPVGRGRIRMRILPRRDWAEAWKRHFKALDVRGGLLVKPPWSRRQPRPGQVVMALEPGLSFGTGQHPTTAFCLEQIVACRPGKHRRSLLDVGTGSGVLAIAAAKLGYAPIEAFDLDPVAVRVAKGNAALNAADGAIAFARRDLRRSPTARAPRFDVVCANLLADLLKAELSRITDRVAPNGMLVLAGILAEEFDEVRTVYAAEGWRLVADRRVKEWRSGAFRRVAMRSGTLS